MALVYASLLASCTGALVGLHTQKTVQTPHPSKDKSVSWCFRIAVAT